MRRHKALVLAACVLIAACVVVSIVVLRDSGRKDDSTAQKADRSTPFTTPASTTTTPTQPTSPSSTPTQPAQPGADETAAVTAAAVSSAKANNPAIGELTVVAVKTAGEWARVDLQPTDKSADVAGWLLKKEGGSWTVVDFGTSILPSNHPGAPAEVFR